MNFNIIIIAYKRIVGVNIILELLSRCQTKDNFTIYVITGHQRTSAFCNQCEQIIAHYNTLKIHLITKIELKNDTSFLATVKYAAQLPAQYTLRLDDDIFPSPQCIDFLVKNQDSIFQSDTLIVRPLTNNGIPTFDMFIQDFCSPEEQESITKHFKNFKFPNKWNVNFSSLNPSTANGWNPQLFYQLVGQIQHHYKGIHPIRLSLFANQQLHQILLKKFDHFLNNDNIYIDDTQYPYVTNGIMLIKNKIWHKILQDKSLFVDPWDEVAINKYQQKTNNKILYVRGGYAIHPIHNTAGNRNIESGFINDVKNKIGIK